MPNFVVMKWSKYTLWVCLRRISGNISLKCLETVGISLFLRSSEVDPGNQMLVSAVQYLEHLKETFRINRKSKTENKIISRFRICKKYLLNILTFLLSLDSTEINHILPVIKLVGMLTKQFSCLTRILLLNLREEKAISWRTLLNR